MVADSSPTLVLGTAQLGMPYGIANRSGMPDDETAWRFVRRARDLSIATFDTARAYGDSERRLGFSLEDDDNATVITKLSPLDALDAQSAPKNVERAVRASLAASRDALARDRLDVVLLHRAAHLEAWHGAVWSCLLEERKNGGIGRLGVSVQSPDELLTALRQETVQHIQLPYNLLDWRWRRPDLLELMSQRYDVTLHARSVLLQGLLAAEDDRLWPPLPDFNPTASVGALRAVADTLGRDDVTDLCLAYVRALPFLDGVVVGAETEAQLARNVALFSRPPLDPDEALFVERFFPRVPEALLNPALWPARPQRELLDETADASHRAV